MGMRKKGHEKRKDGALQKVFDTEKEPHSKRKNT